jgi:hypothetical protein
VEGMSSSRYKQQYIKFMHRQALTRSLDKQAQIKVMGTPHLQSLATHVLQAPRRGSPLYLLASQAF